MERDEPNYEHHELIQGLPNSLPVFWDNQLKRMKQRAENQVRGSSPTGDDSQPRLTPDRVNRS